MAKESLSWIDATGVIAGTAIGAGILALPIALYSFGTFGSALFLLAVGLMSLAAALFLAEALMRTKGAPHLPSLVETYLGKPGLALEFIGILIYVYGALTGYLIAGGTIASAFTNGAVPNYLGSIVYFVATSGIVYGGSRLVKGTEKAMLLFTVSLTVIVMLIALPYSGWAGGEAGSNAIPSAFGVVLFAYFAHELIPSVRNRMGRDWRGLLKALVISSVLPIALYIAWTAVIIGAVPGDALAAAGEAGEPATIPLGVVAGALALLLGSLYSLFSTASSYVGSAFALVDVYRDMLKGAGMRIGKALALFFSVLPPLCIAIVAPHSFIRALEIAGLYGGGISIGVLVPLVYLLARRRGQRKPEFSIPAPFGEIAAVLVLGITLGMLAYETYSLLVV